MRPSALTPSSRPSLLIPFAQKSKRVSSIFFHSIRKRSNISHRTKVSSCLQISHLSRNAFFRFLPRCWTQSKTGVDCSLSELVLVRHNCIKCSRCVLNRLLDRDNVFAFGYRYVYDIGSDTFTPRMKTRCRRDRIIALLLIDQLHPVSFPDQLVHLWRPVDSSTLISGSTPDLSKCMDGQLINLIAPHISP
jgi:hypothetical protein